MARLKNEIARGKAPSMLLAWVISKVKSFGNRLFWQIDKTYENLAFFEITFKMLIIYLLTIEFKKFKFFLDIKVENE